MKIRLYCDWFPSMPIDMFQFTTKPLYDKLPEGHKRIAIDVELPDLYRPDEIVTPENTEILDDKSEG